MKPGVLRKGCLWTIGIAALLLLACAGGVFLWTQFFQSAQTRESRACGVSGEQEAGTFDDTTEFKNILKQYGAALQGAGLQAAVILPDGKWWNGAGGLADIDKQCPLTLEHGLYIGSMTKLYTAALIMQQVERGALRLDEPISNWFDLPYGEQVTVRMLLNHTSGIPEFVDRGFLQRQLVYMDKLWEADELLGIIKQNLLQFAPGSDHLYSSANYYLLGLILEKVTGMPYNDLLQTEIVKPLNIDLVQYQPVLPSDMPVANGYDVSMLRLDRQDMTFARRSLISGYFSAGGLLSRAIDSARFTHALFQGHLVGEPALQEMLEMIDTTTVHAVDALPEQFGYGLGTRGWLVDGERLYGHTGHLFGYSSVTMHNPQKGYTITVLSNLSTIDQAEIVRQLQQALLASLR